MATTLTDQRHAALEDFLSVVRRYKVVIIVSTIVVPVAAFVLSMQQSKVFRATSEVLLEQKDLGGALTGIPTGNGNSDPERYARTQAALATDENVARRALKLAGVRGVTVTDLLGSSDVSPRVDSDLLQFNVDDANPIVATKLASAYAAAFASYKLEQDTNSLEQARSELQGQLADLRASGATNTQLYADLVKKVQDLRTLELLQAKASVIHTASEAEQVQPRPVRTAALGVALGLLVGLGIAFLSNALDKRIRSEDEVDSALGVPLLARLPNYAPKTGRESLVMLDAPSHFTAEAVRGLRTNVELAAGTRGAKTLVVTSAAPQEGKSTTISNLAVALARAGHRVALVDLDLRQPAVSRLFHIEGWPGVTDVAAGSTSLNVALTRIALNDSGSSATSGAGTQPGQLMVLPTGTIPPDPGEFAASQQLANILEQLKAASDYVLIDAPPLLAVGDTMSLSPSVDAMFVVVRLSVTNRPMLKDLARTLAASPAPALGFVLTDVDGRDIYRSTHYAYHSQAATQRPAPVPLRKASEPRR